MEDAFHLPEVWKDDDEIYRLMQRIKRPRDIDRINYDRKIDFWKGLILDYTKHNRILVVTEAALKTLFRRRFVSDGTTVYPECLPQVLNDMIDSGLLEIDSPGGSLGGALNWGIQWLIKKPASWAVSLITGNSSPSKALDCRVYESPDTQLVIPGLLPSLSEHFIKHLCENQSSLILDASVYTEEDFDSSLSQVFSHDMTRSYIRNYLLNKGIVKLESSTPFRLVYLLDNGKPVNLDPKILSSIAHLRKTMRQLATDEERLSKDLASRRSHIKTLLRDKRKSEALALLRRSKQLEAELERKSHQMAHLEALEMTISAAKDNRAVLRAITEASSVLRLATQGAKGVAEAERTMDEMAELIEDTNAISAAIAYNPMSETFDEDFLEAELRDILGENATKKEQTSASVPADSEVSEEELMRHLDALNVSDLPPLRTTEADTGI